MHELLYGLAGRHRDTDGGAVWDCGLEGQPGLTKAINEALSDMDSDGTMDKLETNWFGSAL